MHLVVLDSLRNMSYPPNAKYGECAFERMEIVDVTAIFYCSVVQKLEDVPQLYIFTLDGFKGINPRQEWTERSIFNAGEGFTYDGRTSSAIGRYTRRFTGKLPQPGTYYFVLSYPSKPEEGDVVHISFKEMSMPSYVIQWQGLSPWITGVGIVLTIVSLVLSAMVQSVSRKPP